MNVNAGQRQKLLFITQCWNSPKKLQTSMSPRKWNEQSQMFGAGVTQYKVYGHFSSVFVF